MLCKQDVQKRRAFSVFPSFFLCSAACAGVILRPVLWWWVKCAHCST
jgi:hypothetical protein